MRVLYRKWSHTEREKNAGNNKKKSERIKRNDVKISYKKLMVCDKVFIRDEAKEDFEEEITQVQHRIKKSRKCSGGFSRVNDQAMHQY